MPFIARISVPDWRIPVRAYLHESGIEVYEFHKPNNTEGERAFLAAAYLGENVLGHVACPSDGELFQPAKYLLVALFGKEDKRMAEVFGYGDFEDWPGNPTKYRWTFRDNVYMPEEQEDGCGDTDIVLGEEEKWRRTQDDLTTFMLNPPDVGSILVGGDYRAVLSDSGRVMGILPRKINYSESFLPLEIGDTWD